MVNIIIIGLIVVFAIIGFFKSKIKGVIGESKVALRLKFLNSNEYKVINDVLLESGGRSSQIDHIVISRYGIFVIETKNYKGWIHGNENSEYWLQTIYKYKNRFRNPVIQCKGHIATLNNILREYDSVEFYPIVVFSGEAKLKNVYTEVPVVYSRKLIKTIRRRGDIENLTNEEVGDIFLKIKESNIKRRGARKNHIRRAKKNAKNQKRKENSLICPRCGGNFIVRNGKYGKFHGCSNFPKCKYSKKIKKKFI